MKNKRALPVLILSIIFSLLAVDGFTKEPTSSSQSVPAAPPAPPIMEKPQIAYAESLGKGRFQIGAITVDTVKREILVPGKVNMNEGVIEFIASMKGGFKLYESLL